jgi:hypothetical protein
MPLKIINKLFGLIVLGMFILLVSKYVIGIFYLFKGYKFHLGEGSSLTAFGLIFVASVLILALLKYIKPKQFISDFPKIWKGDFSKQDEKGINKESIKTLSNPLCYLIFLVVGIVFIYSAFDTKINYHSSALFRLIFGLLLFLLWIIVWFRKKKIIETLKRNKRKQ